VPARDPERRRAVGLFGRAHLFGADAQQLLARHLEEFGGIVVAVDEAPRIDVEHKHGLGGVLDQHAVARLAVLERLLRLRTLRGVADADDVGRAALALHRADQDLGWHQLAAAVPGYDLARRQVVMRRLLRGREFREYAGDVALRRDVGNQGVDEVRHHVGLAHAEKALGGPVHALDAAEVVHRDDAVLDVVEDGLEPHDALAFEPLRHRRRLVGGKAHHGFEAGAVVFVGVVLAADDLDEPAKLHLAGSVGGLQ
jgi:hypothetical protein